MDDMEYQEQLIGLLEGLNEKLERMLTGGLKYPQGFEALTVALLGFSQDGTFPPGSIVGSLGRIARAIMDVSSSIDEQTLAVNHLAEEVHEIHGVTRIRNGLTGEIIKVRRK